MVAQCLPTSRKAVFRILRVSTGKALINSRKMSRRSLDDNRVARRRGSSRRHMEESELMDRLTEVKMAGRMQVMTEIIQTIASNQPLSDSSNHKTRTKSGQEIMTARIVMMTRTMTTLIQMRVETMLSYLRIRESIKEKVSSAPRLIRQLLANKIRRKMIRP